MIILTRLNGEPFAVNPDLLERVDTTPDTVLTLLDGTKYVVAEPVEDIIREIRTYRASVIAAARLWDPAHDQLRPAARLDLEPVEDDELGLAPAVPLRRSRRS